MVLDTSVVVAILRREAGFEEYLRAIVEADEVCISAVSLLECQVVLAATAERVDRFIEDGGITIKDFTRATASLAHAAFLRYGKGRHRAALNICDCAAYATAKESDQPLLFKGNDFVHTDIKRAVT
jgi:ribonuclease VapC